MGECGCSAEGIARVPGPKPRTWYVVEVYPGCDYCGTGWAVGLTLVKERSDEWEFFDHAPVAEFRLGMWGAPILDTDVLHRAFAEEVGEEDESADALRDFVAQGGLRRVFYDTRRPPTGEGT